jgi:hypothetical protein
MKILFKFIKQVLFFFSLLILSFGIPILIVSCSSSEYIPEKMDTSLQQKIHQLEKENSNEIIQFTGKTNTSISDEVKGKLQSTGITTESIVQDIFTASGNLESIKKLSLLECVKYLELAKKLDLK